MELHPHRVVRIDARRCEPVGFAGVDATAGGPQPGPVVGESKERATQGGNDRADAVVDRIHAVDDRPVVARVAMVVGHTARSDLPVAAHADELAIEAEEPLVGALDRSFDLAAGLDARPYAVQIAPDRCEPEALGDTRHQPRFLDAHH